MNLTPQLVQLQVTISRDNLFFPTNMLVQWVFTTRSGFVSKEKDSQYIN